MFVQIVSCKINANGVMVRKERCSVTKCRVSFLSLCCEDSRFLCSKQQKEIIFHFFKQKKSKIVCFTKKRCTFASQLSIGLWCNGNTADSGPAFPGSSPGSPTKKEVDISTSFFCCCLYVVDRNLETCCYSLLKFTRFKLKTSVEWAGMSPFFWLPYPKFAGMYICQ